jgi:hypothetical protein
MKLVSPARFASAVALALLGASVIPTPAQTPPAQSPARVIKLRVENVTLCDQPNGKTCRPYARGQFKDPWPVVGQSEQGFLPVQVDGAKVWVRGYAVETDVPFRINADCDAVVASRQPKVGATRGIGEECVAERKK